MSKKQKEPLVRIAQIHMTKDAYWDVSDTLSELISEVMNLHSHEPDATQARIYENLMKTVFKLERAFVLATEVDNDETD